MKTLQKMRQYLTEVSTEVKRMTYVIDREALEDLDPRTSDAALNELRRELETLEAQADKVRKMLYDAQK